MTEVKRSFTFRALNKSDTLDVFTVRAYMHATRLFQLFEFRHEAFNFELSLIPRDPDYRTDDHRSGYTSYMASPKWILRSQRYRTMCLIRIQWQPEFTNWNDNKYRQAPWLYQLNQNEHITHFLLSSASNKFLNKVSSTENWGCAHLICRMWIPA